MAKKTDFISADVRLVISFVCGLLVGSTAGIVTSWKYAPLAIWDITILIFLASLMYTIRGMNAQQTSEHALRENPGRAVTDALLLLASIASLGAVGAILVEASSADGIKQLLIAGFGILSVVLSWAIVHSLYTLRYARLFYKNNGGIDFNNSAQPRYSDFAYVAFTIGMTFQVSDTSFQTHQFRKLALRHALLAYLFGTAIVASTINLIAGLGQ